MTVHIHAAFDVPPAATPRDHDGVSVDPVLERRRRIAGLVATGQRVGYGLFGLAMALFVAGLVAGFETFAGPIVASIVIGSVVLAPAIVFGYAVKAAERDDREHGRSTLAAMDAGQKDPAAQEDPAEGPSQDRPAGS